MKKYLLAALILGSLLIFNSALAQSVYDDSSGSGDSSGSNSSSGSDDGLLDASSNSGLEIETEHGVTFLKAYGNSGQTVVTTLGLSSEGLEIETEHGVSFLKPHGASTDSSLEKQLSGRILLQVQSKGEAWWIDPSTGSRLFLGRPDDAFRIMRENGLGITNSDLDKIVKSDDSRSGDNSLARRLAGKILLQVQSHGEAWYIDPITLKRHSLGRPAEAFAVMRGLGLGITDNNLNKIKIKLGEVGQRKVVVSLQQQNNSGQLGYAEIKEIGSQVKVEVVLSGEPAGAVEPSHIHLGNLPNLGAVKYPLNSVVNGKSETVLNVSFDQLLSERPLGINVHKSAAEIGVYVAAGNL